MDENIKKEEYNEGEMLEMCLNTISEHATVGIFLQEVLLDKDDNVKNQLEVSQVVSDKPGVVFRFTPEYVFVILNYKFANDTELLAMRYLFDEYLKKSTTAFMEAMKHPNDEKSGFMLVFDILGDNKEDKRTYRMTFINPLFSYKEENILQFVFPMSGFTYGVSQIDDTDVKEELEYERKSRIEEYQKQGYEVLVNEDGTFL